ncbi:MAG: hypothetical protein GY745_08705 [Actinomycetia bacterium]|nr:hypothetical protein [Actinomycetes bacterium]
MAEQLTEAEGAEFTQLVQAGDQGHLDDEQVRRLHDLAMRHALANPHDDSALGWWEIVRGLYLERFPPDQPVIVPDPPLVVIPPPPTLSPSPVAASPPPPVATAQVPALFAQPPPPQTAAAAGSCPVCNSVGSLATRQKELTTKRRPKFGVFYVLLSLTLIGFPIAIILWLIMPRKTEVVGVDRWMECSSCKSRI